jgi:hypothetical protein
MEVVGIAPSEALPLRTATIRPLKEFNWVDWVIGKGKDTAKYRTIDEPVPKELRAISQKKTTIGWIKFRLLHLLPKW